MFPAELTLVIDHGQGEQSRQSLPQSQSTEKIRDQAGGLEKRRIDSGICRRGDKAPIDLSHLKRLNSLRKRVWERGRGTENPEVEDETRSAKGEFWRIRRKLIVETIGWKRAVCLVHYSVPLEPTWKHARCGKDKQQITGSAAGTRATARIL